MSAVVNLTLSVSGIVALERIYQFHEVSCLADVDVAIFSKNQSKSLKNTYQFQNNINYFRYKMELFFNYIRDI